MPARDIYTTVQGDSWDLIAYKVYGDSYQMDALLRANPEHRATLRFSAGVEIVCPDVEIAVSSTLPPWKV
jgi:phage tail protein X